LIIPDTGIVVSLEGGNVSSMDYDTPVKLLAILAPPLSHGDPADLGAYTEPPWVVSTLQDDRGDVLGYGLESSGSMVTQPGAIYLRADAHRAAFAVNGTNGIEFEQASGFVSQESFKATLTAMCYSLCQCGPVLPLLNPDDHSLFCPYARAIQSIDGKLDHRAVKLLLGW